MCPFKQYPASRSRKVQALVSVASFPCAVAAIVMTHGAAESWMQVIAITVSGITPLFLLSRYRKSGKQNYPWVEVATDAVLVALLIGTYIGGIVILATRGIRYSYRYKLAHGIPQIYSNLSCLLLSLLYVHSFARGILYRYMQHKRNAPRDVTYVICPSCDRTADASVAQMGDDTAQDRESAHSPSGGIEGWYRDDEVDTPLLRDQSLDAYGKQESGIVINADRTVAESSGGQGL